MESLEQKLKDSQVVLGWLVGWLGEVNPIHLNPVTPKMNECPLKRDHFKRKGKQSSKRSFFRVVDHIDYIV